MKFRRGGQDTTGRKAFKNALRISQLKTGGYTGAAWPRKRGSPKSAKQQAIIDQFRQACDLMKIQDSSEQAYAINNSPGKLYMPRDIQMAAMFGVLTRIYTKDGNLLLGRRVLSGTVQQLLNQISETPGDMLVRTATEWIALSPLTLGYVLSSAGPGNVPYWQDVSNLLPTVQDQLDTITTDAGAMIYRSGTAWLEINAGTAGQVLTSHGSATAPDWQTPTVAPTWAFDSRFTTTGTTVALASIGSGNLIANAGTATAEPGDTTLDALLDLHFGTVEGAIITRGASTWTHVSTGTLDDVLVNQGTTAIPAWQSPATMLANAKVIGSALITNSVTQTVTASGNTAVTFGTKTFDTGGFWTSGNVFIVPSGCNYVELAASVQINGAARTLGIINFSKNGSVDSIKGMPEQRYFPGGGTSMTFLTVASGPIAVSNGDTLGVNVFIDGTAAIIQTGNQTFFSINKVG